jgi:hypothetical protein
VNFSDPYGTCPFVLALAGPAGAVAAGSLCALEVGAVIATAATAWLAKRHASGRSLVPTKGGRPTREERDKVNEAGDADGCMTCGGKDPGTKSGEWVPNHVPPTGVKMPGEEQQLGPHCIDCSRKQGGYINAEKNRKPKPEEQPQQP